MSSLFRKGVYTDADIQIYKDYAFFPNTTIEAKTPKNISDEMYEALLGKIFAHLQATGHVTGFDEVAKQNAIYCCEQMLRMLEVNYQSPAKLFYEDVLENLKNK